MYIIIKNLLNNMSSTHYSPCKSKVVRHIAAATAAVPLIEPQIYPAREQSPCKHDGKRWVYDAHNPSNDCRNEKEQRNVQVAQLPKRRIDQDMVRHRLLNRYSKAGQVAGHTMDVVIKQEVCVLRKQV